MRLCLRLLWGSHWQCPKKIKEGVWEIEFCVLDPTPRFTHTANSPSIYIVLLKRGSDRRSFIGPSRDNYNNSSAVPPASAAGGNIFYCGAPVTFSRVRRKDNHIMKDQNEFGCQERLAKWLYMRKSNRVTEKNARNQRSTRILKLIYMYSNSIFVYRFGQHSHK